MNKGKIRVLKNHIMFIDQCVVRLTVYEEVRKVNLSTENDSPYSIAIEEYLVNEIKEFANNYDDDNNNVYQITESVNEINLKETIEALLSHYARKKKDKLEELFLLS